MTFVTDDSGNFLFLFFFAVCERSVPRKDSYLVFGAIKLGFKGAESENINLILSVNIDAER